MHTLESELGLDAKHPGSDWEKKPTPRAYATPMHAQTKLSYPTHACEQVKEGPGTSFAGTVDINCEEHIYCIIDEVNRTTSG